MFVTWVILKVNLQMDFSKDVYQRGVAAEVVAQKDAL